MNKPRLLMSEIAKLESDLRKEKEKSALFKEFVDNCANLDPMTLVKPHSVALKVLKEVEEIERSYES